MEIWRHLQLASKRSLLQASSLQIALVTLTASRYWILIPIRKLVRRFHATGVMVFTAHLRGRSQDVGRAAAGLSRGTWAAGEMDAHPSDCRWSGTWPNRCMGRVGRSATTAALTPRPASLSLFRPPRDL
jgi:hypothetical protein